MSDLILDTEQIATNIFLLRGNRVLLDYDLASLYHIETKRLNEAVKRNRERFPVDFMFELTKEEFNFIKNTQPTKHWREYSNFLPNAFTEQGVAMLSSVLRSQRAVQVNIAIMRTFVQMRRLLESNKELYEKIQDLEKRTEAKLNEQDVMIKEIFDTIKYLIRENTKPKELVGFHLPKAN